jgi:hypothetical protein
MRPLHVFIMRQGLYQMEGAAPRNPPPSPRRDR